MRRPLRPPKPDRPPLRKPSGWTRGRSGPAERGPAAPPRRESGRGRGWAAGRRRSRQSDNRVAAGPSGIADGEAEVAQRGFVGVEAQDLGRGRGALKRQAGAQRPGGGRIGARDRRRAKRARRRRRTADRPALPFRPPAPRPGRRRWGRRLAVRGFSPGLGLARARVAGGAGPRSRGRRVRSASRSESRRESLGHGGCVGGALSALLLGYPPRLSCVWDVR